MLKEKNCRKIMKKIINLQQPLFSELLNNKVASAFINFNLQQPLEKVFIYLVNLKNILEIF